MHKLTSLLSFAGKLTKLPGTFWQKPLRSITMTKFYSTDQLNRPFTAMLNRWLLWMYTTGSIISLSQESLGIWVIKSSPSTWSTLLTQKISYSLHDFSLKVLAGRLFCRGWFCSPFQAEECRLPVAWHLKQSFCLHASLFVMRQYRPKSIYASQDIIRRSHAAGKTCAARVFFFNIIFKDLILLKYNFFIFKYRGIEWRMEHARASNYWTHDGRICEYFPQVKEIEKNPKSARCLVFQPTKASAHTR